MDEMHALGALFNGYLLEILISKILFLEQRVADFSKESNVAAGNQQIQQQIQQQQHMAGQGKGQIQVLNSTKNGLGDLLPVRIQLIAMSATVGNVTELAAWFGNTRPFISSYRPVSLFEKIVAGDQCCNRKGSIMVDKLPLRNVRGKDIDGDDR